MYPSLVAASCTRIGGRQSQEDRLVSIPDLNAIIPEANRSELDPPRSFFGIFDGHGGHACSDFLAKRFHTDLAQSPLLQSDPKAALLDVWGDLDRQFYDICVQVVRDRAEGRSPAGGGRSAGRYAEGSFPRDGSTATVLLLVGTTLFAANCGDSAGILVRKNGIVQALTTNHDTLNPQEFERVRQCGGFYRQQTMKTTRRWPLCCFEQDTVVGKPRVYPGGLLVTRSFGDFSAKVLTLGGKPGVILPDCQEVLELAVEEDWAELIIASDGVWDVMAPKEMPRLLAKPDGTGRRKANAAPSTGAESESAAGGVHEGGSGDEEEEHAWTEETWKLEQAQLSGTCAKMVMTCVRHRYWADNQAVPDNASAVILRFFAPEPRGGQSAPPPMHQPTAVATDPVVGDPVVDPVVDDPVVDDPVVVPPAADAATTVV